MVKAQQGDTRPLPVILYSLCYQDLQAVSKLDPSNRHLQTLARRDQLVSLSEWHEEVVSDFIHAPAFPDPLYR